jgi:hypothetical protein
VRTSWLWVVAACTLSLLAGMMYEDWLIRSVETGGPGAICDVCGKPLPQGPAVAVHPECLDWMKAESAQSRTPVPGYRPVAVGPQLVPHRGPLAPPRRADQGGKGNVAQRVSPAPVAPSRAARAEHAWGALPA